MSNLSQIPTVKGEFLLGSMREFTRDTLQFLLDTRPVGDLIRANFGPFPLYISHSPDINHEILVSKASAFEKTQMTKRALNQAVGQGLFTNEGESWKRQRKLAQPSFHTRRIASYADVMAQYARDLSNKIKDQQIVDVDIEMSHLTMQIISKTVFDAHVEGENEMTHAVNTVLKTADSRFNNLFPLPDWLPTPANQRMKQALRYMDTVIQSFIDERRQSGEDKGDLLSMLISAQDEENGTGMSDKQLRDECMTIFGAGHETTSGTMTWAFYLLAKHPDIAEKLYAEIDSVLGDRLPTFEDLPNLPYTEMVIKETMRLYPSAWGVTRQSTTPVTIGGYDFPKDSLFMLSFYGVQRDERYFSNPDVFMPERFTPENEKLIPKHAYIPFGAGPRVCIGNAFAMMEARLILATWAQRLRFELIEGFVVKPERVFTLRPANGMKLIARMRQAHAVAL